MSAFKQRKCEWKQTKMTVNFDATDAHPANACGLLDKTALLLDCWTSLS